MDDDNEIDELLKALDAMDVPAESALAKVGTQLVNGALSGAGGFLAQMLLSTIISPQDTKMLEQILQALGGISTQLNTVENELNEGLARLEVSIKEGDLQQFCDRIDAAYTGYLGGAAEDAVGKLKDKDDKAKVSAILGTFKQFQESVQATDQVFIDAKNIWAYALGSALVASPFLRACVDAGRNANPPKGLLFEYHSVLTVRAYLSTRLIKAWVLLSLVPDSATTYSAVQENLKALKGYITDMAADDLVKSFFPQSAWDLLMKLVANKEVRGYLSVEATDIGQAVARTETYLGCFPDKERTNSTAKTPATVGRIIDGLIQRKQELLAPLVIEVDDLDVRVRIGKFEIVSLNEFNNFRSKVFFVDLSGTGDGRYLSGEKEDPVVYTSRDESDQQQDWRLYVNPTRTDLFGLVNAKTNKVLSTRFNNCYGLPTSPFEIAMVPYLVSFDRDSAYQMWEFQAVP